MKTMTSKADISADGWLHLDLPCDLPPGPVDVVVVVQPVAPEGGPPYDTLAGALAGLLPGDVDLDAELDEMNRAWEKSLGAE